VQASPRPHATPSSRPQSTAPRAALGEQLPVGGARRWPRAGRSRASAMAHARTIGVRASSMRCRCASVREAPFSAHGEEMNAWATTVNMAALSRAAAGSTDGRGACSVRAAGDLPAQRGATRRGELLAHEVSRQEEPSRCRRGARSPGASRGGDALEAGACERVERLGSRSCDRGEPSTRGVPHSLGATRCWHRESSSRGTHASVRAIDPLSAAPLNVGSSRRGAIETVIHSRRSSSRVAARTVPAGGPRGAAPEASSRSVEGVAARARGGGRRR